MTLSILMTQLKYRVTVYDGIYLAYSCACETKAKALSLGREYVKKMRAKSSTGKVRGVKLSIHNNWKGYDLVHHTEYKW